MQDLTQSFALEMSNVRPDPNVCFLLDQIKTDLNLAQGEINMVIPDMPNVPPQNVPGIIAQANQAQAGSTRTIGVCHPAPSNEYSGDNGLVPITSAQAYFDLFEHRYVSGTATTTILQQPKHGALRLLAEADGNTFGEGRFVAADQLYVYLPEQGYLGKDSATTKIAKIGVRPYI